MTFQEKAVREGAKRTATVEFIGYALNPARSWGEGVAPNKMYTLMKQSVLKADRKIVANYIKAMPYQAFLDTPYWKAVSGWVKHRAKGRCQMCGKKGEIAVHHRTYMHHGDEVNHLEDLICLCRECHAKFHDKLEG